MTSKSGTNRLRGSLFEYLRNEKLDARNFFALAGGPKPPYKLNQFGASLGGPVMLPHYSGKDRTFFFVDYEGYREVFGSPLVVTVPTAAERAGNFQGITANGIYDPLTLGAHTLPRRSEFRRAGSMRLERRWRISIRCRRLPRW